MQACEEKRLETLYRYQILDSLPSTEFDSLTRLAMGMLETPIAFVSFVDQSRQWFKSIAGLDWTETDRSLSFCTYTIQGNDVFVVQDARMEPRFRTNPLVTGPAGIRFYAGAPIVMPNGCAIGTLAAVDRMPRRLNDEKIRALQMLAREAMVHVELHLERQMASHREEEGREVQRKLTALMKNLPGMAFRCKLDAKWTMEFVSEGVFPLTGYRAHQLLDNGEISYAELIHEDDRQGVADAVAEAVRNAAQFQMTYRIRNASGRTIWVWEQGSAVTNSSGRPTALEGFITDITEKKEAEQKLAQQEERLRFALEGAGDGIWDQNLAENRIYLSPRCKEMLGYADGEIGTDLEKWTRLVHPDDLPHLLAARQRVIEGEDIIATDERRQHKDGTWRLVHKRGMVVSRDREGRPVRMIGTYTDVTDAREQETTLLRLARSDVLTGLPNRRLLAERLHEELAKASDTAGLCALLFIDLDGFKEINDQLGHEQGDRLLIKVGQRLTNAVRDSDMVARLGGDEFVVLLSSPQDLGIVESKARNIVARLAEPYSLHGEVVNISASVGVAVYPLDTTEEEKLLEKADQAMYRAKSKGRNRMSF